MPKLLTFKSAPEGPGAVYWGQASGQYGGCFVLCDTRIEQRYLFHCTMTERIGAVPTDSQGSTGNQFCTAERFSSTGPVSEEKGFP